MDYCLLNTAEPLDEALSLTCQNARKASRVSSRAWYFLLHFLIGLLAALIPVAIHLIRREKPPKVMFSTIRFLKTSKKLVLFQHLRQIALLLLRAAVIVLLVLAFARPLLNQSVARLLDADPQSAVILLDLSMSMRWQDNFDQAKAEALAVVDRLSGVMSLA